MTRRSAPGALRSARAEGVRVAFYGRVARDENPQHALQQQLRAVRAALPSEVPIVGRFVDVGPWNGLSGSTYASSIASLCGRPVDGGVTDLLDRTMRPDRHFDVVACSDADRLSRRLVDRVRIEDDLAAYGVRVVTAVDPAIATLPPLDTPDTTQKRLRRWAWDLVTAETTHLARAVRDQMRAEGWHLGPTPYGYATETLTVDRRQRRRLVADPVCAEAVRTIFAYRAHHGLGVTAVARALNADPHQTAARAPDTSNAARPWSPATVRAILANPVYTGHLVSNRVDAARRLRPITEWTWSPTPAHEPIIAVDVFLAAHHITTIRQSSADDHGPDSLDESTTRQQPRQGGQR
jgi:DNA invertase Pin-like site-specific DNA recombinase